MTLGKGGTAHLPSMDNVENSTDDVPMASPCSSMDRLLHLSTEEQEMDVEGINTSSGEINETLLCLVDSEEESGHGSTKSKDGDENFLKEEKCARASGVSIKEKDLSIARDFSAQDSSISKRIGTSASAKRESNAGNGKTCSSESLEDYNCHDAITISSEDEEVEKKVDVESTPENIGSVDSLCISAVEGACNSLPGMDVEEGCSEKPVNAVEVEQLSDNGGDSVNAELGGGGAAAVNAATSQVAPGIPEDSSLILLTWEQLEQYVKLRMRDCLVAEHNAQRQPIAEKYYSLQKSLVRWRSKAMQMAQQLQTLKSAGDRQAGVQHRPQQRSVGMLVRLPCPEQEQPPSPPVTVEPPPVTMATQLAPSSVAMAIPTSRLSPSPHFIKSLAGANVEAPPAMATHLAPAPTPATTAIPTSKLSPSLPHLIKPVTPTIVSRATAPAILQPPRSHLRETASNSVQPTTTVTMATQLVKVPRPVAMATPTIAARATVPAILQPPRSHLRETASNSVQPITTVTTATQLVKVPHPVAMATPTIAARATVPAILQPPRSHLRETVSNSVQPITTVTTATQLVRVPHPVAMATPTIAARATVPAILQPPRSHLRETASNSVQPITTVTMSTPLVPAPVTMETPNSRLSPSPPPFIEPVAVGIFRSPPVTMATRLAPEPPSVTMATPTSKLLPSPPPLTEPISPTIGAPSVTTATRLTPAPPLVTLKNLVSKLPVAPTIAARTTLPAILQPPRSHLRATASNSGQPVKMSSPLLVPKPSAGPLVTNAANVTSLPGHTASGSILVQVSPVNQQPPMFSSAMAMQPVSTAAIPVGIPAPPVRTVAVPVSMASSQVLVPVVPGGMGTSFILMPVPSAGARQPATPRFFAPAMVVAGGDGESLASPQIRMFCMPQPVVGGANGNMRAEEGTVGMLMQLPSANQQQQPSFAPVLAGPSVAVATAPDAKAVPPVAKGGLHFSKAGPPVVMATPPVAMSVPPVAMVASPVTMATPPVTKLAVPAVTPRPVSSSRSDSPRFFHPSMAALPSFRASQISSPTPTSHPLVAAAQTTSMTTVNAPSSTSEPETVQVIIDTASDGTPLPDETGCVGRILRLAPSELQKLASVSSAGAAAPVAMETPASSLPSASPPSVHPPASATSTGKSSSKTTALWKLLTESNSTATQTGPLSTDEVIDLTLDDEPEGTPAQAIPGTGLSSAARALPQASASAPMVKNTAPTSLSQVQSLSSHPAAATTGVTGSSSSSELAVASPCCHSVGKAAHPSHLPARVKYYMPNCVLVTHGLPGTEEPEPSGSSEGPVPVTLVPVNPPSPTGLGTAVPGGTPAVGGLLSSAAGLLDSPSETSVADSTAIKETCMEPQVPDNTPLPLPDVSSCLVTNVTWSGSAQAVVQNSLLSSPPMATTSLSSVSSPCVPTLVEMGEDDAQILTTAEAGACDAERPKRTAADRMRDCRLRKKLVLMASPVKKVPKSGAQRIREFRERLKARSLASNGNVDEQQVLEQELSSGSDHADSEPVEQVEDNVDLILICESESCPSSPDCEENDFEMLETDAASP